jgi:hypothetical protein
MRHVTVRVYDYAGVPADTMATAQVIAGDAYRAAGIEVEWVMPSSGAASAGFFVNVLPGRTADMLVPRDAVGFAAPGSVEATVLFDRIIAVSKERRIAKGVLLGYVMAHEIGHLLLPAHSHSVSGLMRANLDVRVAAEKRLRFTGDEAQIMRTRLTEAEAVVSTN